jgi:N-acetylglucosaminyldiphosphoundecaprenol N-acetyl-beta-D-mannosaminyltransferase
MPIRFDPLARSDWFVGVPLVAHVDAQRLRVFSRMHKNLSTQRNGNLGSQELLQLAGDTSDQDNFVRAAPRLGRERTGILLTESVGIPVHAVLTPGNRRASKTVLNLLQRGAGTSALITFANPSTVLLARRSAAFARDLLAFDLVLPDGIGMCIAIRWLHGLPARRVSFDMTSLGPAVFEHAQQKGMTIALVGGVQGIAERARDRIVQHFPGLQITGTFAGFGDMTVTIGQIVALEPDIVICGMGGSQQEAFLLDIQAMGWRGWGFTCGGFLDQLHARLNYYPRWVDRANLRWAYRLVREPRRLWRRYLIDYTRFGLLVCAAWTRK